MSTTTYANSPVKSCSTCVHCVTDRYGSMFDKCDRFRMNCEFALNDKFAGHQTCGTNLREWRPKPPAPPKRSLRQWLYDLLIA